MIRPTKERLEDLRKDHSQYRGLAELFQEIDALNKEVEEYSEALCAEQSEAVRMWSERDAVQEKLDIAVEALKNAKFIHGSHRDKIISEALTKIRGSTE